MRRLKHLLRGYPAVALLGARQCGKTTLGLSLGTPSYDLEQESERLRLDLDWEMIAHARSLIVLDEAQAYPEIFPRLRGAIDAERRRNGRFLILGSVSPTLMRQVSESLAGRLGICDLSPFLLSELGRASLDRLWISGGFPDGGVLGSGSFPEWQGSYLRLMAERDLPEWGLPAKPQASMRLFRMLATCHGAVWKASEVGRSMGLSYHTVNTYLDFLEGAYLVRRLPPLHRSIRKRLVKSPKLYWRDTGLLHSLLGARSAADVISRPWVGASWEGFVIEQVLGHLAATGVDADPSFFRTSDGHEVDLVLDLRGRRWAIEVKLTTSPGRGDMERLVRVGGMAGADRMILVTRTSRTVESEKAVSTDLGGLLRLLAR